MEAFSKGSSAEVSVLPLDVPDTQGERSQLPSNPVHKQSVRIQARQLVKGQELMAQLAAIAALFAS